MTRMMDQAITPGGRVGDASPLGTHGPRRLDDYVREVAHALMRKHGWSRSHAIAVAKNSLKRWRRGGGHVRPQVRAGAAAHLVIQKALDARGGVDHALAEQLDLAHIPWREALHPRLPNGEFKSKIPGGSVSGVRHGPAGYELRRLGTPEQRAAKLAAKLRSRYEVYHSPQGTGAMVEYRGHEIGFVTRTAPNKYVTGSSEHATANEAARAIIDRHLAGLIAGGRKKQRSIRRRGEGGGVNGLIQSGILFGSGYSQFSWEEKLHPRGHDGKFIRKLLGGGGGSGEARHVLSDEMKRRHATHYQRVDAIMQDHEHLSTDRTLTDERGVYTAERRRQQENLIRKMHRRMSKTALSNRQSLFLGGLPGAGKTTTLRKSGVVDPSHYVIANPDDFKEEMAKAGMIPEVPGHPELSPMERAQLVHEEASALAMRLARRAAHRGQNVAWDITMTNPGSVAKRLDHLDEHGYSHQSVFVDVPIETSFQRVQERHMHAWLAYLNGHGEGGRPVPRAYLEGLHATPGSGFNSVNRESFQKVAHRFGAYQVYDEAGHLIRFKGKLR